jgi:hypothetical protein
VRHAHVVDPLALDEHGVDDIASEIHTHTCSCRCPA